MAGKSKSPKASPISTKASPISTKASPISTKASPISTKALPINTNNAKSKKGVRSSKSTKTIRNLSNDLSGNNDATKLKDLNLDNSTKIERIRFIFLSAFIAGLTFVLGLGIGNRTGDSVVDNAINRIISNVPNEIDKSAIERAAIEGALKATGDQWANYFPNSALDIFNNRSANQMTGIGIALSKKKTGALEISQILDNSPAGTSQLKVGDQVLEVNGTDVQGASVETALALIRSEIGSAVDISAARGNSKFRVTLKSEKVSLQTVKASQIENSVGYFKISNFATSTYEEMQSAFSQLNTDSGVIIDLRNNPGGLIQSAVDVAGLFVKRGVITSYKLADEEKVYSVSNPKPIMVPLVIIVNRNTSSAAEMFAAAMQDRNRGVVIGERTYGKGSVQDFVELKDGSKLEITVALYLTPAGRSIEGVGVTPDLVVKESDLIVKALQILGGLAELSTKK
jgi:carboxyl-terminal processing protease